MKNRVYFAFDGDNDIRYYWLMKAWKHNQLDFFNFFDFVDAHDLNSARDSSQEESIKKQLRARLDQSKLFVLLIGDSTRYLYKFVKWEIEQAIERRLPIIAINLNGKRHMDADKCPTLLQDKLVLHVSFNQKVIERALGMWIDESNMLKAKGLSGPYYFSDEVYKAYAL